MPTTTTTSHGAGSPWDLPLEPVTPRDVELSTAPSDTQMPNKKTKKTNVEPKNDNKNNNSSSKNNTKNKDPDTEKLVDGKDDGNAGKKKRLLLALLPMLACLGVGGAAIGGLVAGGVVEFVDPTNATSADMLKDSQSCLSDPCQNDAICQNDANGYSCQCTPGYMGENCATDIDECANDPCKNGGTCIDNINGYNCTCISGYEGENCTADIDECLSEPCLNGGTCQDTVNGYTCKNAPGYAGKYGERDINECLSDPCKNNGTCEDAVDGYTCQCIAGYVGNLCQTDFNECSSGPCQNSATCDDSLNDYSCQCAAGYTGVHCETDIDECLSDPCQNEGTCHDAVNSYMCENAAGYTGLNGETEINECDSDPCQNDATCEDAINSYTCQCGSGYTGVHCETDIDECLSDPCQHGGTCHDAVNGYTCQNAAGYTGLYGETEINECSSDPCQNSATCQDAVSGYSCGCAAGYTGVHCETDIDECSSNPCQNGATCQDAVNSYLCQCADGYTGVHCETDIDECLSDPCENGGTCLDAVNGYTCENADGYTGEHGETDINECASDPCKNGGTCQDAVNSYLCECADGYTGVHCETDIDECLSDPCRNGGTCHDAVNSYTCENAAGYTGEYGETEIDECSSDPCQNGATCQDAVNGYSCQCAAGYTGVHCETNVDECSSDPCENSATCQDDVNSYSCQCAAGYTGIHCETDIDECLSDPCKNGGTCDDAVNGYTCENAAGYTGEYGETDIDECSSDPCQNSATCQDAVNSYSCQCAAGYTGVHCETDIDECVSDPCQNGGDCQDAVNGYTCECPGWSGDHCETCTCCVGFEPINRAGVDSAPTYSVVNYETFTEITYVSKIEFYVGDNSASRPVSFGVYEQKAGTTCTFTVLQKYDVTGVTPGKNTFVPPATDPMVVGPGRYVGHSFTNYGVISYEESTVQNYCMSPSSPAVGETLTASFTYSTRSYSMMTYYTCGLPTWTVYDNHDCQGNDIGTTHVSTIYECEKACKANPDCGAVVFAPGLADQGQTSCWFKAMGACTPAPYTGPVTGGLMVAIPNDVVVALTGDNSYKLFVDGDLKWEDGVWDTVEEYPLPYTMQVVAVFSQNTGGPGGILLSTNTGFWSDSDWKCSLITDVNNFDWTMPDFDDSSWEFATVYGDKTHPTWSGASALDLIHTNAKWIWTHDLNNHMNVGCRKRYAAFAALSCTVDLSSAGLNDADKTLSWAHANSQKETVFQKRSYSFFEIQVSKTSCALGTQHHFDTFDGATKVNDMVNYMNGLSAGTLIACATWDENSANMPGDGYNTLMSVFGVDATSLEHRGSISFVATVGDASKQTSVIKGSTVGPATLVAVYQYEMVLYKSNKKSDVSPASTSTVPDADRCAQLCNIDDACTYAGTVQQSGGIDADWDCHSYTSDVSGGTFSDVTGYKLYRAERITKSVVTN